MLAFAAVVGILDIVVGADSASPKMEAGQMRSLISWIYQQTLTRPLRGPHPYLQLFSRIYDTSAIFTHTYIASLIKE